MSVPVQLPSYDELPIKPHHPPRSAWGVFGDDDQIGTLNLLTPERVAAAAGLVQKGAVFALNWELGLPDPPLFSRAKLQHSITRRRRNVFDDVYDNFNTQSSSQWDGLRHYGHPEYGFYNGVTEERILGDDVGPNGIEHWARRGIAGRGVLIDFPRFAAAHGIAYAPAPRFGISASQLRAAADWQRLRFDAGDILLLRTGWIEWYNSLDPGARMQVAEPGALQAAGLHQSEDSLRFLWDHHFAAIASDNPTFEAFPPTPFEEGGHPGHPGPPTTPTTPTTMMHGTIIGLWGMPIGEMFNLDSLAAACATDHCYEFFFTSAPLNKPGGVASPPNALAIL
ncbi:MAG: cyclase family protein [Acidobacteriota bacterium]